MFWKLCLRLLLLLLMFSLHNSSSSIPWSSKYIRKVYDHALAPCYESEGEFVGAGSDLAGHTPRSFVSIMVLLLCLILSLDWSSLSTNDIVNLSLWSAETWRHRHLWNHHMLCMRRKIPLSIASLRILSMKKNTIRYRLESLLLEHGFTKDLAWATSPLSMSCSIPLSSIMSLDSICCTCNHKSKGY